MMVMGPQNDAVKIAVVGAGIAGLHCAKILKERGFNVTVFDKELEVGGRMKTSEIDGFLIDHGFHVLQTAYPETSKIINYKSLECKPFKSGARVVDTRNGKIRMKLMADPWRNPIRGLLSSLNGFLSFKDLLRIALLRRSIMKGKLEQCFDGNDETTLEFLQKRKLSEDSINRFFLPLFGGIFLESELNTSERLFRFIFRMMAKGKMVLPKNGIGSIPLSIANQIGDDNIRLGVEINRIEDKALRFRGEAHRFDLVIKAFSEPTDGEGKHVWTIHFDAPKSPLRSKHILLNGNLVDSRSIVSHLAVPSDIQPSYAPSGRSLVTATVVGDRAVEMGYLDEEAIEQAVRNDLGDWFGDGTISTWNTLAIQHITHALPITNSNERLTNLPRNGEDAIECGDHMLHGSVEGAILSGRNSALIAINRFENNSEPIQGPKKKV
tara:strand:+ start:2795 stop:4105 length:1311 start_codon:yes stop_codon:yes gene_type:complete